MAGIVNDQIRDRTLEGGKIALSTIKRDNLVASSAVNGEAVITNLVSGNANVELSTASPENGTGEVNISTLDEKVKITSADPVPGFLDDKIDNDSIIVHTPTSKLTVLKVDGKSVDDTQETSDYLWTASQIIAYIGGALENLTWQKSVLSRGYDEPPVSPSDGDRYIIGSSSYDIIETYTIGSPPTDYIIRIAGDKTSEFTSGDTVRVRNAVLTSMNSQYTIDSVSYVSGSPDYTDLYINETIDESTSDGELHFAKGAWAVFGPDEIVEYESASPANWVNTTAGTGSPTFGWAVWVIDEDLVYYYNNVEWIDIRGGGGGVHNSLLGLQGGAASQYYHLVLSDYNALTHVDAQLASLVTSGTPTFSSLNVTNKLTVGGLIDPTGLVLDPQGSTPLGADAGIWIDSADRKLVYNDGTSAFRFQTLDDLYNNESGSDRVVTLDDNPLVFDFVTNNTDLIQINTGSTELFAIRRSGNFVQMRVAGNYSLYLQQPNYNNEFILGSDIILGNGSSRFRVKGIADQYDVLISAKGSVSTDLFLEANNNMMFQDGFLSSFISLSETGVTALTTRNTKTSIIGVINELNNDIKGLLNDGSDNFNWSFPNGNSLKLVSSTVPNNYISFDTYNTGFTEIVISNDDFSSNPLKLKQTDNAQIEGDSLYLVSLEGGLRLKDTYLSTVVFLSELGVAALTSRNTKTSIIGVINELNSDLDFATLAGPGLTNSGNILSVGDGSGLTINANSVDVNVDDDTVIISGDALSVQLADSTLTSSGSGLKVSATLDDLYQNETGLSSNRLITLEAGGPLGTYPVELVSDNPGFTIGLIVHNTDATPENGAGIAMIQDRGGSPVESTLLSMVASSTDIEGSSPVDYKMVSYISSHNLAMNRFEDLRIEAGNLEVQTDTNNDHTSTTKFKVTREGLLVVSNYIEYSTSPALTSYGDLMDEFIGIYGDDIIPNKGYVDALIGSTVSPGSSTGQMLFWNSVSSSWVNTTTSELYWNDVSKYLGINTTTPVAGLTIGASSTSYSLTAASDVVIGGNIEVQDESYFSNHVHLLTNKSLYLDGTGNSVGITWDTSGTNKIIYDSNSNTHEFDNDVTILNDLDVTNLITAGNDVEITDNTKGVILSDGTDRWRITVDTNGDLITTKL